MTEHVTTPMNSSSAEIAAGDRPSVLRVLRDQRKTLILAAALMAATYWVSGQLGEWRLAALHRRRDRPRPAQPPRDRVLAAADHLLR